MTLFADQSQHLENNWANIGRQDGEALRAEIEDFWRAWPKGEGAEAKRAALREKFSELAAAAKTLRSKLPGKKLRECKPQLKQMELLAEADVLALDWLEAIRAGDEKRAKKLEKKMGKKREKIVKNEDAAKISETVCRAFLDEALKKEK